MLSGLFAAIGLVIAAQTSRRAYSTVAILAAFILTSVVAASVFEAVDQDAGRFVLLLSPGHVAQGFTFWFFGAAHETEDQLAKADLPGVMYAIDAALAAAVMLVLLLRRYQKIST